MVSLETSLNSWYSSRYHEMYLNQLPISLAISNSSSNWRFSECIYNHPLLLLNILWWAKFKYSSAYHGESLDKSNPFCECLATCLYSHVISNWMMTFHRHTMSIWSTCTHGCLIGTRNKSCRWAVGSGMHVDC